MSIGIAIRAAVLAGFGALLTPVFAAAPAPALGVRQCLRNGSLLEPGRPGQPARDAPADALQPWRWRLPGRRLGKPCQSASGYRDAALQEYEQAIRADPAILDHLRAKLEELGDADAVGEDGGKLLAALRQCVRRGCRLREPLQ